MADIELVIRIDEGIYNHFVRNEYSRADVIAMHAALINGTQLPKGHGDIVDIETLIDMFWDGNSMEITKYDLSVIEPIIEANKAESEE